MKKLLSLIILSAVILSSFTISACAAEEKDAIKSGDYTYILKGNDAQIIKYTGNSAEVNIPETIDGHKVIKVGYDLASVESYYSSKDYDDEDDYDSYDSKLGKFGFAKKNVVSVKMPDTVKELGYGCFYKCEKLKNISLSKNLTYIPQSAFSGCTDLKSIKLPDNVTEICDYSFHKTNIESIKLPKKLNYFNIDAFYNSPLKKLKIDKNNKSYSTKDGVLYNKKKTTLIYYPENKTNKSFTIPKSVTRVRISAVQDNKYLEKITVSKRVKYIDTLAFAGIKNLKEVTLKNTRALIIDEESFDKCKKLSKVNFSAKAKTTICMNAFCHCKMLKKVYLPKKVKIKSFGIGYVYAEYDSSLEDYYGRKIKGFTIKGKKNSSAHKYAKKNKFKFIAV